RTTRAAGVAGERGAVTDRADRAGPAGRPVDLAPGEHVDAAAGAGVAEAVDEEEVRLRRHPEDGVVVGGEADRAAAERAAAGLDGVLEVDLPGRRHADRIERDVAADRTARRRGAGADPAARAAAQRDAAGGDDRRTGYTTRGDADVSRARRARRPVRGDGLRDRHVAVGVDEDRTRPGAGHRHRIGVGLHDEAAAPDGEDDD